MHEQAADSIAHCDTDVKWYCGTWAWFCPETGDHHRFFCGSARCGREYCQRVFWLKRVTLIADLIREYDLRRFWTLTFKRGMSRKEAWEKVAYTWAKLRRVLKRKYPSFQFVAILEAHKDGYPHIHMFCNVYIPVRVMSGHMSRCGGGSYVWAEYVNAQGGEVAEYVTKELTVAKYVGKDQVVTAKRYLPKKARTFWRSSGMKTKAEQQDSDKAWALVQEDVYRETENRLDIGLEAVYNESIGAYMVRRLANGVTEGEKYARCKQGEPEEDDLHREGVPSFGGSQAEGLGQAREGA